jgi:hypothetical protein
MSTTVMKHLKSKRILLFFKDTSINVMTARDLKEKSAKCVIPHQKYFPLNLEIHIHVSTVETYSIVVV